jgi:hypothetical protein
MYAIRRHQATANSWCWRVRFSRRGVLYSKSFYDLACGGSRQARALAIAWRDAQLAKLEALTLLDLHKQKRSNNVSGVPGVHFHKTSRQPHGFWQAKIRFNDGKTIARGFAVLKHGQREAFRLAVAARIELLAKVENRAFLRHPVAKRLSRAK